MKALRIVRFVIALVFCASASAEDYPIRLHRPVKVGERFKMAVTGATKKVMSVMDGDKVVKSEDEEFTGTYDAVETILEAGPRGRPVKVSAKIAKLTKTENGQTRELLPDGTVIVASKAGPRRLYEVNGNPVDAEAAKVLELLIRVGDESATDDEVFGTTQRKKAGESWPMNATVAAKDLEKQVGGSVKDITGSTTLEAVNRRDDGDTAKISMRMKGTFAPPLPPGFIADASHFEAEASGELPADVAAPMSGSSSQKLAMEFAGHATGRSGNKVVMNFRMGIATVIQITPVP